MFVKSGFDEPLVDACKISPGQFVPWTPVKPSAEIPVISPEVFVGADTSDSIEHLADGSAVTRQFPFKDRFGNFH